MTGRPEFDHHDDGTPADAWAAMIARLPAGADGGPHDHLVVLVAHPDDESLGAGGLLADAATSGAQVTVIVATDGEASHPQSPTHTPDQLAQRRRREIEEAVRCLAPDADLVLLGLPDGGLAAAPDRLRAASAPLAADATVIAAPWRADGHPDHETCGTVAAGLASDLGARLLEFPIWGWHWGEPGHTGPLLDDRWVTHRTRPQAARAKAAALAAHRSQHEALSPRPGDEPLLGTALLEHFARPVEVFRAAQRVDLPSGYFERLYAADPDPWRIADRFYEQRKRALTLAALPRPRFRRAFEPGCGPGLTTVELAGRCDQVVAMDASARAAAQAAERTARYGKVEVRTGAVPADWPGGKFDLVLISELGYYLADPDELAARVHGSLSADGVVLACHWRHPAPGYPTSAEDVHAALGRGLFLLANHVEDDFRLEVWSTDRRSVAQREGIVGEDDR